MPFAGTGRITVIGSINHTHRHTQTHTDTHRHTQTRTHTYTHIHTYTHTYTNHISMCSPTRKKVRLNTSVYTSYSKHKYTYMAEHIQTRDVSHPLRWIHFPARTHINTNTRTHTHTHTHTHSDRQTDRQTHTHAHTHTHTLTQTRERHTTCPHQT